MSYNVENFFDIQHDEGKQDWAYIPKSHPDKEAKCKEINKPGPFLEECLNTDWNQARFNLKLANISSVIRQKEGLDLIGLVEVENEKVVKAIAEASGFNKFLVTNSPDERGVDVGLLYRESKTLKLISSTEIVVDLVSPTKPTRNILQALFEVSNGSSTYPLLVFVNHWPSQSNPSTSRVRAAELVMKAIEQEKIKRPNLSAILMGDFNTVDKDFPHPFNTILFKGENALFDVHGLVKKSKDVSREKKNALPLGTEFFEPEMSWSYLDRFFVTKNLSGNQGLVVDLNSYDIFRTKEMITSHEYTDPAYSTFGSLVRGVPLRCDHNANNATDMGYSDHFPITMKLEIK